MFAANGFQYFTHCIATGRNFFVATGIVPQLGGNMNSNNRGFGNHDSPP